MVSTRSSSNYSQTGRRTYASVCTCECREKGKSERVRAGESRGGADVASAEKRRLASEIPMSEKHPVPSSTILRRRGQALLYPSTVTYGSPSREDPRTCASDSSRPPFRCSRLYPAFPEHSSVSIFPLSWPLDPHLCLCGSPPALSRSEGDKGSCAVHGWDSARPTRRPLSCRSLVRLDDLGGKFAPFQSGFCKLEYTRPDGTLRRQALYCSCNLSLLHLLGSGLTKKAVSDKALHAHVTFRQSAP